MGNLITARIEIEGVRPLLWHAFGPDSIPLEKQERTGVAGNDPEEWRKTVLATKDGQLYLESSYLFGCLRDAARYTKQGRGSIQNALMATLQVTSDRIIVDRLLPSQITRDHEQPVYLDVRSVRNPATKGRNVRYRVAASPGWRASAEILWDKTIVSTGQMQAVLRDAGTLVGLGDGRSIGFGRFSVTSCDMGE